MYESDDIIQYLANTYGNGVVPTALKLGPVTALACGLSGVGRYSIIHWLVLLITLRC
jgi:hypothetical protein